MINGREISVDVAAQDVTEPTVIAFVTVHRAMRALARAVGVAVSDESPLEDGLAHRAKGVVYHPVAERSRRDHPVLGIVHLDLCITSRTVAHVPQLTLQAQHFPE